MRQKMRTFDTYTHINDLKEAGFDEKQAAVIIKSLVDSRETDISHLATKEQVISLETQVNVLKIQVGAIEHRVGNIEKTMATKEQVEMLAKTMATKEDMKDMHISTLKWMIGTMIAFSGILLAGIKLL